LISGCRTVARLKNQPAVGFWARKKINFSQVFAGQAVGIKEVHDDIWLVSFMDYDLGYFDLETRVLEPLENPFGPKVLPM
jgi:putative transposase